MTTSHIQSITVALLNVSRQIAAESVRQGVPFSVQVLLDATGSLDFIHVPQAKVRGHTVQGFRQTFKVQHRTHFASTR